VARSRLKAKGRAEVGTFALLPHAVMDSEDFRSLSGSAHTYPDGNTSTRQDLRANPPAESFNVRYSSQISERFIDRVHLDGRDKPLDDCHHSFAHVTVQCVVAGKHHHAPALQVTANLKVRRAHLDSECFGLGRASYHAAVIVGEHYDRGAPQIRAENSLTARIE